MAIHDHAVSLVAVVVAVVKSNSLMKPEEASFGYPEVNLCSKEQCERQ